MEQGSKQGSDEMTEVNRLLRKENLLVDTERECLGNGKKGKFLNQQSSVCVTRQGQLERMDGYQNLNWKQLEKDK